MIVVTLLLLLIVNSVSGFGMGNVRRSSSNMIKMDYKNEIGALPPLGFFDPLGLLKEASKERFDRLRYVELKHGRISMVAITNPTSIITNH